MGITFKKVKKWEEKKKVDKLINALKDKHWSICESAANALGRLKDTHAVEPILNVLNEKIGKFVVKDLVNALGELRDSRAVELLIEIVRNKNKNDYYPREEAAIALGMLGDVRAVEPLIEVLDAYDKGDQLCRVVVKSLSKLGDVRAVDPLINFLKSQTSDYLLEDTANALGTLRDTRAVGPLIRLLGDKEPNVRKAAVNALESLGEKKWKDVIKGLDQDFELLARVQDKRIVDPFIEAMTNSNGNVRKISAEVLGKLGKENAVIPLIDLLSDAYPEVREVSAKALGALGDIRAVDPLIKILIDTSEDVRKTAAEALAILDDKKWKLAVKGDDQDFERLYKINNNLVIDAVILKLLSNDGKTRISAAEALGRWQDIRAVEPLTKMYNDFIYRSSYSGDPEKTRLAAVKALEALMNENTVKPLIKALSDHNKNIRKTVAEALIKIAKKNPAWLRENWDEIKKRSEEKHTDENRANAPNCTIYYHEDTGIGIDFPNKPSNLDF